MAAGARFAVAPGTNDEVVEAAQRAGVPFVPGVATPSEIEHARSLGCTVLKVFPASVLGGPAFVKAVAPVYPDVRFVPTGGISPENVASYLELPAVLACGGTWICERSVAGRAALRRGRTTRPGGGRASVGRRGSVSLLSIRSAEECRFDLVALGEVMLRFDPGDGRIATTRTFAVSEGGGEYNVARGLRRCFGLRTAIVTAFADNPVGRLLEDLILQGGVDQSYVMWRPYDGIGRSVRNGLNFVERGFGVRAALGTSDRAHSAAAAMQPGDVDWDAIFGRDGARWFHCGGIFAALAPNTADVALEAMTAARRHGTIVSFDLNYRPSLWKASGGPEAAAETNRRLVGQVDVLLGNEEDFSAALGYSLEGVDELAHRISTSPPTRACTARSSTDTRTSHSWRRRCARPTPQRSTTGAVSAARARRSSSGPELRGLEIYDRVGGGDSFASGLALRAARRIRRRHSTRVRGRPRRARDDDARRHVHGDARRGRARHARRQRSGHSVASAP